MTSLASSSSFFARGGDDSFWRDSSSAQRCNAAPIWCWDRQHCGPLTETVWPWPTIAVEHAGSHKQPYPLVASLRQSCQ